MSQQGIALRELGRVWDNACGFFEDLGGEVYPKASTQVFVEDTSRKHPADRHVFLVKPVTFVVPERAANPLDFIYIVAKGRIGISASEARALKTLDFGTEVGYFRRKDDHDKDAMKLDHIYGAHFDYAPGQAAHPLFHAQMNDLDELKSVVAEKYRLSTAEGINYMRAILRNARLPSAQMDIFSFMLQVAADHMVCENSTAIQRAMLGDLAGEVRKLKGMSDLVQKISTHQCTRGVHWYQ